MKFLSLLAILLSVLLCPQLTWAKGQTVSLTIPTMDCATCPITIKAALMRVPGVSSAKVNAGLCESDAILENLAGRSIKTFCLIVYVKGFVIQGQAQRSGYRHPLSPNYVNYAVRFRVARDLP